MSEQQNEPGDESLAQLLRMAGPRPRIPDDVKARVRAAAHDEWQAHVGRRRRARLLSGMAVAATLAGALILFRTDDVAVAPPAVPAPVVARVQSIDGSASAVMGQEIRAHAEVATSAGSTMSLDWNGATLRLDAGSRVRFDSAGVMTLAAGAIFFSDEAGGMPRTILTPFGSVRDIGTEFEVRLQPGSARVRVREGRVEITRGNSRTIADAGTELLATGSGIERSDAEPYGDEWAWIERAAPQLVLEGRTLGEVMQTIAHEKGLTLDLPAELAAVRLRGQVPFSTDEALTAATAAAGAEARIERGRLVVRRAR